MWDNHDGDYSKLLWKRIEKFSFFCLLSQFWKTNFKRKKLVLILLILLIIWVFFIVYPLTSNTLLEKGNFMVLLLVIGAVIVLVSFMMLAFILLGNLRFDAWIYSKWINLQWRSYLYRELKELKLFHHSENWNEYIKLIYIKSDGKIITEDILYNPKMDTFLRKLKEILESKGINCETITDIKNIEIKESIECKVHFWFLEVLRLLSWKEKMFRIKKIMSFVWSYLFFWVLVFVPFLFWGKNTSFSEAFQQLPENFYLWLKVFLILFVILVVFLTVHFISSVKKFYARIENNAIYIHNGYGWKWSFLLDSYVLPKIKVKYWFIVEWNVEWIMLTIENGNKTSVYKRPKNEEIEYFCSKLVDLVKKYKYS